MQRHFHRLCSRLTVAGALTGLTCPPDTMARQIGSNVTRADVTVTAGSDGDGDGWQ